MHVVNRIEAIKAIRNYIRSVMEPMIDNALSDSPYIRPWTKDSFAEHIREATELASIKFVVDSFCRDMTPSCEHCMVIHKWTDDDGNMLLVSQSGNIYNHFGVRISSMDEITLEAFLSVVKANKEAHERLDQVIEG